MKEVLQSILGACTLQPRAKPSFDAFAFFTASCYVDMRYFVMEEHGVIGAGSNRIWHKGRPGRASRPMYETYIAIKGYLRLR